MIITIDGPAGSGKSTIAVRLKEIFENEDLKRERESKNKKDIKKFNFEVLDTGAIFRSFNIYLTEKFKKIDLLPEDIEKKENLKYKEELIELLDNIDLEILDKNGKKIYLLFGEDITKDLRDPNKMKNISKISASKIIREKILEIEKAYAEGKNIIVEGRDTGTVVFPKAEFKFYLDSDIKERALRRYLQEEKESKFNVEKYEKVLEDLKIRDEKDKTREVAPLKIPEGAIIIDNTKDTIDDTALKMIKEILKN